MDHSVVVKYVQTCLLILLYYYNVMAVFMERMLFSVLYFGCKFANCIELNVISSLCINLLLHWCMF